MTLEKLRKQSIASINPYVPQDISKKLKLIQEAVVGSRYHAVWSDGKHIVICSIEDYKRPQCPVRAIKMEVCAQGVKIGF